MVKVFISAGSLQRREPLLFLAFGGRVICWREMPNKQPLDPLIPLDELKKVVGGLIRAPKPEKPEPKKPS